MSDSLNSINNSNVLHHDGNNMISRQRRQITTHYRMDPVNNQNDINFPKTQKVRKKELFFGVLLPFNEAIRGVNPAMQLAIDKVISKNGILEGFNITMEIRDTQCSSVYGPLAAFELYTKRKPGQDNPLQLLLLPFDKTKKLLIQNFSF